MDPNTTPVFDWGYEWTNPALGSQPDAFHMQGAAAGTGLISHRRGSAQSRDQPHIETQHPQAFKLPSSTKSACQPGTALGLDYVCLVSDCGLLFRDANLLDQHVKSHFLPVSPTTSWATQSNGAGSSPFGNNISGMPHGPASAATTGVPGVTTNVNQVREPRTKIPCQQEGCDKVFGRLSDLERHARSHQSGPREFECPARKCRRKGVDGFWRVDKLKDHIAAKHPEMEVERWYYGFGSQCGGLRDVTRVAEHEDVMFRKGYKPNYRAIHSSTLYLRESYCLFQIQLWRDLSSRRRF
ncbi:MAG: hypothetical protein LQ351_002989 [Letrouitia transgressa]|nr:MAG: hypothetical protein LQ351_002989 [Letrouitia transgressa]